MDPSITIWCNLIEQVLHNVHVAKCASPARIYDGGNGVCAGDWVVDGDLLVTDWIVVWVATVVHYSVREGDDGVSILNGTTA